MPSTYIDIFDFTRATSGLEWQSLLGNAAHFTTLQAQGATSLSVPASGLNAITVQLNQFDHITIMDGSNTEVVQVGSAGAPVGATSIPLLTGTSLQFAHAIGVAWCSDGAAGSLADQIVNASKWIEATCYQSLLQTSYVNEPIDMPGIRASVSNRGALTFRPWHWPVTAISALTIATSDPTQTIGYDVTKAFIGGNKRLCSIRNLLPLSGNPQIGSNWATPDRNCDAQLLLSYTAGFAYSNLPGDLKEAAVLVTSDLLAKRHNPIGAAQINSGGVLLVTALRGDVSGESELIKRVMEILSKYSVQLY